MRRRWLATIILVTIVVVFLFAPIIQEETASFGGGPTLTAHVSLSFALFQCGAYIGVVGIQVPNGDVANPEGMPFWESSSNWNCQFPHVAGD